jgi:cytochrome P450
MPQVGLPVEFPGPSASAHEQVRRWIENPIDFWLECERLYGSAFTVDLGSLGPIVVLADPECVRDVFRLPPGSFECREFNEHYRYLMGDRSLFLQDGETHALQRRLLVPLLRHKELMAEAAVIAETASRIVDSWPSGRSFNPRPYLHEITFRTMVRLILGETESLTARTLIGAHRESVARSTGTLGPWRNFSRMQPRIRALLAGEIRVRRSAPDTPGLLTMFAHSSYADGIPLADEDCQDHVLTLLVAGVDTSAISLAWALHWLSRSPEALARLNSELAEGAQDVYLQAVFRETLRMYPIGPNPSGRKIVAEQVIGPYAFAAGTTLVPCTFLVHRREEIYPNASAFRPERFLERRFTSWEYFPFGGGLRSCLGEMLAQYEFKAALPAILKRWKLEPTSDPPLIPERHGTLLAPAGGFEVTVR